MSNENVETNKGNKTYHLRRLHCEFNVLTRLDGSVILSQGGTCIVANMLGPAEVKFSNSKFNKAHIQCVYRPKRGLPTVRDKVRESIIVEVCEACMLLDMHPRSRISIHLQELDDKGGLDASAINAACLALLIGGAPMKFTIAAIHCAIDINDKLVLDPEQSSKDKYKASFIFVFDSLKRNLIKVHNTGCFKMSDFINAHTVCRSASSSIFKFYRDTLKKYHTEINTNRDIHKTKKTKK